MQPPEPEKLRRIHMDAASCSEFASSSEGIKPLVAPTTMGKHNKYPNKGLYPKTEKSTCSNFPSFSKASDIYMKRKRYPFPSLVNVGTELPSSASSSEVLSDLPETDSDELADAIEPVSKRKKKEIPSQNNKITGYMIQSDLPVSRLPKDHSKTKRPKKSKTPGVDNGTDVSLDSASVSCRARKKTDAQESLQMSSKIDNSDSNKSEPDGPEYFGLFGATEAEENEPDHFNKLPSEVMERIFCELPFLDLRNCKHVCRLWNDVITNGSFIHWKTTYYKLKYGEAQEEETLRALLLSLEGHSANGCLHALVRFMREGFSRKPAPDMYDALKKHKKFSSAESVLKERFPDWSQNLNPWCIVAALVLVSEEVSDVFDIIQHLLSPGSGSSAVDVLESLYCIASFLLYCMSELKINHGLHYRVHYSLYMYENHVPVGLDNIEVPGQQNIEVPGQQTMHSYCKSVHLTYEQCRIVGHHLQRGDVIKIVAFAGSGKTSTLIELARRYPHFRFLNVMFNKSVCEHAQKLFPNNVKCQTAHSLAFASKGKQFMRRLTSKFSADIIRQYLKLYEYPFEAHSYCKAVIITIQNFMASDDTELTMKHTPDVRPISNSRVIFLSTLTADQRLHICHSANKIWRLMSDRTQNCPVTHDVYLKLYQMSKPKINQYHCIMVDEAQDCNAAMLDIVLSQKAPVILVGDPHQQIYGFRGSKNALRDIKSTHTYHLTKSFRFGPEIAYVASCCIEVLKGYKQETLIGCNKPSTVSGVVKGQYAIITRSNVGLFNEAIRLCCLKNYKHEDEPRLIYGAFVGGITSYGLDQIEDIYRLKALTGKPLETIRPEDRPRDKFIKIFQSFRSLLTYTEKKEDTELAFKIELVMRYSDKIPEFMTILRRKCSTPLELANVVFSTAHKAKGFEFETVRLGDDYNVGRNPLDIISRDSEEEYNVMYVALTRAKSSLFLSEKLYNVLLLAQEKFEYPVLSHDLMQNPAAPNCVLCFTKIEPHTALSLIRRNVTLTTGRVLREGPLCMKCAAAPYYRPQVIRDPVIMYLDPMEDFAHRSMKFLVGPLPSDPPVPDEHDAFRDLHAMDLIYVINVGVPH